ncbi:hypothetical protein AT15_00815 [Kosmotoga arenicorallina S304]|uniref:Uncharacterized protein n=1 Tax=Kosmotoga arenicorallina S304 TaxID=1453497 RepID=A0A176K0F3_9BACT|nr:hypothetical protein [Kosmotoga arenicorallina]OAA30087.1 hypothetical protein AT15_00815 [Kosmotoga arenicorallina S304]
MRVFYILFPFLVYYDLSFYDILPLFPIYMPLIASSESEAISLGLSFAVAFLLSINTGSVIALLLLGIAVTVSNYLFRSHIKRSISGFVSGLLFASIATIYLKLLYLALIPLFITFVLFREKKHEFQTK